jgi:hypothetical protein
LHSNDEEINAYREKHMPFDDASDPDRFIRPFQELGLTAGPVNAKAGDLILFDTACVFFTAPQQLQLDFAAAVGGGGGDHCLRNFVAGCRTFHAACPATDPGEGSMELRRAICIMSMVPRLLLSPTIIKARRLAYEVGRGTGGTVMAREGVAEVRLRLRPDP